jgi:hypothetical protein
MKISLYSGIILILFACFTVLLSGCGGGSDVTGINPLNASSSGIVEFTINAPDIPGNTKNITGQVINPFVQTIDIYLYNDPGSFDPINPTSYTEGSTNQWRQVQRSSPGSNTWSSIGPFENLPFGKKVAFFVAKNSAGVEMARRTHYFELTPENTPLNDTVNLGAEIGPDGNVNPGNIIVNLNDILYWVNNGTQDAVLNFPGGGSCMSPADPDVIIPPLGMAFRKFIQTGSYAYNRAGASENCNVYVNDHSSATDNTNKVQLYHNDTLVNTYSTIGDAITAAAAGDTILVGAGIYTESLNINKPLTIKGENKNTTIIQPAALISYSVVYIYPSVSGMTDFSNFTVKGIPYYPVKQYGIRAENTAAGQYLNIHDNIVNDISTNSGSYSAAIVVANSKLISGNVSNNVVSGYLGSANNWGIVLWWGNASTAVTITGNSCTGSSTTGQSIGIYIDDGNQVTLQGNQIAYHTGTNDKGIYVDYSEGGPGAFLKINSHNNLQNNTVNIGLALGGYNVPVLDIKNNVISYAIKAGIDIENAGISSNVLTIQNNLISANPAGIIFEPTYSSLNNPPVISGNNITTSGTITPDYRGGGLVYLKDDPPEGTIALDASGNWWGSSKGPSSNGTYTGSGPMQDQGDNSKLANGTGSSLSSYNGAGAITLDRRIIFYPFLSVEPAVP